MNKKAEGSGGFGLTGGMVVKLLVGVLCLGVLVYFGVELYYSAKGNQEAEKGKSELNEIFATLKQAESENQMQEYSVLYAPNWYLFSSEFPELCDTGPYCLCICKDAGCGDLKARACIATDKFVSLRTRVPETGKIQRVRAMSLENYPLVLKLSFVNDWVYPYTPSEQIIRGSYLEVVKGTIPIFFKFYNEWIWSLDLQSWMKTSTIKVSGGEFDGISMTVQENIDFLNEHMEPIKNSKQEGERLLNTLSKLSEGVYVIEK